MKEKFNKSLIAVLIALLICGYFLYSVSEILTPFLIGLALAYFLSPLVNRIQKLKVPRTVGSLLCICLVVLLIVGLSFTIIPIIGHQVELLQDKLANSNLKISDITKSLHGYIANSDAETITQVEEGIKSISKELLGFAGRIIQTVITSGLAAFNIFSIIFITPIVMFYLLVDWNTMVTTLQNLVPKRYRKTSNQLFSEINTTLSGYIRGQSLVCLIMGVLYAMGFLLIGLESAIALGMISGLMFFIPYVGPFFSSVLCMIVATIQFGDFHGPALVLLVFVIGQGLESHLVTPKLLGDSTGLHPLWIIFGLLAGGALLGFVGVLIALPLTAILGVVIRFSLKMYKKSRVYNQ